MAIDLGAGIAPLAQASGNGVQAQLRRLDIGHLVPFQRTGDARVRNSPHRVGRGYGAVAGILVVVDEDPFALLLPPATRRLLGHPPLDLTRERERGAAYLVEAATRVQADEDVNATRAGGLGKAAQTVLLEHFAHPERDLAD